MHPLPVFNFPTPPLRPFLSSSSSPLLLPRRGSPLPTQIKSFMQPYLSSDGNFLLRPSSTSPGQLTLAVTYRGMILNFKICHQAQQFYIAPSKKFTRVQDLLEHYRHRPITSKKQGNAKVYLLKPIPVDEEMERLYEPMSSEDLTGRILVFGCELCVLFYR